MMKKLSITTITVVALLLTLTGCADFDPTAASPDVAVSADHIWQAGNGAAWHGYDAPDVDFDAETAQLCAAWSDDVLFTRDDAAYSDTDHFSYDFSVSDGEDWQEVGSENGKHSADGITGCLDLSEWEDGTYLFRVKANARHGTGQTTTTHHSENWEGEVVIGAAWTIELTGGNQQNLEHNANGNRFTFGYELYHGDDLITDCGQVPDVSWDDDVEQHTCDPLTGERNLHLANPDKGEAGTWTLEFHWNDASNPFASFDLSTTVNGGGGSASAARQGR